MLPDKKEIKKRQEHFLSRRPSRYEEKLHVPMLIEIFSLGGGRAQFCTKALIVESTFYEWLERFPEFKTAYQYGVQAAECIWESMGKDKEVNTSWWLTIMKNRFDYTQDRKVAIPKIKGCKEFSEHYARVIELVQEGKITAHEANQFGSLIVAGQKIVEMEKFKAFEDEIKKLYEILGVKRELGEIK